MLAALANRLARPVKPNRTHPNFRSLAALDKHGSSARVLNLASLAARHGKLAAYAAQPFFRSPQLNRALILKHRRRANDPPVAEAERATVTKVIIPFDPSDLGSGGASFLVGQTDWLKVIRELSERDETFVRDQEMLECLDKAPSFDPFLLQEHLRRHGLQPADCYFAIAAADRDGMRRFVEGEISVLIERAFADQTAAPGTAGKLADILLASDVDERLEPLRLTLRLEGDSYRAGIFGWKGFLYYKWASESLLSLLRPVIGEIGQLELTDRSNSEVNAFVEAARARVQRAIQSRLTDIGEGLETYDAAFAGLTQDGDAIAFREFLLNSPPLFMRLGEQVGALSHIATYWRYRFPVGASLRAETQDILDILRDFEGGLTAPGFNMAA